MKYLVTGGAGFIGSNFLVKYVAERPDDHFHCIDKLSYASNLASLNSIARKPNYQFSRLDLVDPSATSSLVNEYAPDVIIHFAAESHVDRSISNSKEFVLSNVLGTERLLAASMRHEVSRFVQISTDEVYGSLAEGLADEESQLVCNSPYSASKGAADLIALSYYATHGLDLVITRCSNNYGRYQNYEKFIPTRN